MRDERLFTPEKDTEVSLTFDVAEILYEQQ